MAGGELALNARAKEEAERLLIEAAQRDPSRFAELYEHNCERVYACIARRARDRDEAEDLTSEVFHQALANLARFEGRGVPLAAGLFRIAANAIIDRAKRAAKERDVPGPDQPPEVGLEDIEQRAQLFRLVSQLPPDQHRVIVMRFAEQKRIREIAHELGRTEGAVKQLQLRAALGDLPEMTMRFLASLNRCTVGVSRFSEPSHWERHPTGDELLHILEGEADVVTLTDGGPVRSTVRAGSIFICPRGLWHRVLPRSPVSLLFATPGEGTEHSSAKDPRRMSRGRAPVRRSAGRRRAPAAPAPVP